MTSFEPEQGRLRLGKIEFDDPTFRPNKVVGVEPIKTEAVLTADLEMLKRWRAHRTGLAPYYPLLYSLVIGMGAQRVFEFGTGESSYVLHAALLQTGGRLITCSPEPGPHGDAIITFKGQPDGEGGTWTAMHMTSELALADLRPQDLFDLVLHDGSHSAEVVAADLIGILPRVRNGGLVLVHDVLHSYVGKEMRAGVGHALRHELGIDVKVITLPFAFGLQILQVYAPHLDPVSIGPEKASSPHRTLRVTEIP